MDISIWDIYALYRHIIDGLKLVAHRGESIASIGIDTWGSGFLYVSEKDGNLLRQPYAYRDPHTVGAPEALSPVFPVAKCMVKRVFRL